MNELLIAHNLGLGDHFICNGLVNYLCKFYDRIFLPVLDLPDHSNLESIRCLYSENPKVSILELKEEISIWNDHDIYQKYNENYCLPILDVEMFKYKPGHIPWYKYFYEQFGIGYDIRYKYFSLPTLPESVLFYDTIIPPNAKYRLIHNKTSVRNFYPLKIEPDELLSIYVDPELTKNLLNWTHVIKNATEIHVIDSSMFCFVDSIKSLCKGDLYYHDIRLSGATFDHQDLQEWKVICYDVKL